MQLRSTITEEQHEFLKELSQELFGIDSNITAALCYLIARAMEEKEKEKK